MHEIMCLVGVFALQFIRSRLFCMKAAFLLFVQKFLFHLPACNLRMLLSIITATSQTKRFACNLSILFRAPGENHKEMINGRLP